jgi:hypothetical protein
MAYELHIEGEKGQIRLEDWKSVVTQFGGVRLCSTEHSITNPESGETISFPHKEGDVEFYFATDKEWRPTFFWSNGRVSFKAMLLPNEISDQVWQTAAALASRLGAIIRGDEGEVYDLNSGETVS